MPTLFIFSLIFVYGALVNSIFPVSWPQGIICLISEEVMQIYYYLE